MKKTPQEPLIHRDMIVADIVGMFPEAADIITSYGLHCVGCHVNAYETIGQGLLGHGYPEEHLQSLLDELNGFLAEKDESEKVLPKEAEKMKVTVSKLALKKIQEIGKEEKRLALILRVEVKKVGDGLKHGINFIEEEEIQPTEKVFSFLKGKVRIVASKKNYKITDGLEVDYVEEKDRAGFKMKNPHASV